MSNISDADGARVARVFDPEQYALLREWFGDVDEQLGALSKRVSKLEKERGDKAPPAKPEK